MHDLSPPIPAARVFLTTVKKSGLTTEQVNNLAMSSAKRKKQIKLPIYEPPRWFQVVAKIESACTHREAMDATSVISNKLIALIRGGYAVEDAYSRVVNDFPGHVQRGVLYQHKDLPLKRTITRFDRTNLLCSESDDLAFAEWKTTKNTSTQESTKAVASSSQTQKLPQNGAPSNQSPPSKSAPNPLFKPADKSNVPNPLFNPAGKSPKPAEANKKKNSLAKSAKKPTDSVHEKKVTKKKKEAAPTSTAPGKKLVARKRKAVDTNPTRKIPAKAARNLSPPPMRSPTPRTPSPPASPAGRAWESSLEDLGEWSDEQEVRFHR